MLTVCPLFPDLKSFAFEVLNDNAKRVSRKSTRDFATSLWLDIVHRNEFNDWRPRGWRFVINCKPDFLFIFAVQFKDNFFTYINRQPSMYILFILILRKIF